MSKTDIRAKLLKILNEGVSTHPKFKNILYRYDLLDNLQALLQSKNDFAKGYDEGLKMASQIYLTKTKGLRECKCLCHYPNSKGEKYCPCKVLCPKGDWVKKRIAQIVMEHGAELSVEEKECLDKDISDLLEKKI